MIVDSSVWIEVLRQGPLSTICEKAMSGQTLRVPTLVIHEVYKKLARTSDDLGLQATGFLSRHEVLDLDREVAILAGDLCLKHNLSTFDGLILAHAERLGETLLTLDNDFAGIERAKVIRK